MRAHSYDPFGMMMPHPENVQMGDHTFGFQGQLADDELHGNQNSYAFKARIHDPRIGRFLSIDPLAKELPYQSPYVFSENRLFDSYELEGKEADRVPKTKKNGEGEITKVVTARDNARGAREAPKFKMLEEMSREDLKQFKGGASPDQKHFGPSKQDLQNFSQIEPDIRKKDLNKALKERANTYLGGVLKDVPKEAAEEVGTPRKGLKMPKMAIDPAQVKTILKTRAVVGAKGRLRKLGEGSSVSIPMRTPEGDIDKIINVKFTDEENDKFKVNEYDVTNSFEELQEKGEERKIEG